MKLLYIGISLTLMITCLFSLTNIVNLEPIQQAIVATGSFCLSCFFYLAYVLQHVVEQRDYWKNEAIGKIDYVVKKSTKEIVFKIHKN